MEPIIDPVTGEPTDPSGGGIPPAAGAEPPAASPPVQEDPPADPDGVTKRIGELTKKRRDAERDAAYWRGVAEASTKAEPAPAKPVVEELDPQDFDSDAEYLRAVAKKMTDEIKADAAADRAAKQMADSQQVIAKQYGKGRAKYNDFDEVALSHGHPVTQQMFDAAGGENLSDILYHLGKNPAEASRIALLTPVQQIKEIGRIEDRITAKPSPTKTTNAPAPPTTLGGGGGSPPVKPDEEKTQAELNVEWEAERLREAGVK